MMEQTLVADNDRAWTAFETWLKSRDGGSCLSAKPIRGGEMYVGIKPLLFHWTMIVGVIGDVISYEDRWCYETRQLAEKAFAEWDGTREPTGWHRHPRTGRRRPDGDPSREYVDP